MTFAEAARKQYLRSSYYTVWLIGPNGEKESMGSTSRKTGAGLMSILREKGTQERLRQLPGAEGASFKKTATALLFSNGWRMEFGGTIRQEAAGEQAAEDEATYQGEISFQ